MHTCSPELGSRVRPWERWRNTVLLAALVLAARVAYLVCFCPYELAADEAHYWEWARRPALSYYSKGPGVAWLIAASTRLLGSHEWAVRLPSALVSFACALLLARLARAMSGGNGRAGLFAAVAYLLLPVFYGSAQFMTIDAPYYACWVLAALCAWRIHQEGPSVARLLVLGALIGFGMLFKYTILLLLPGLVVFFLQHPDPWPVRRWVAGCVLILAAALLVASPIFIWNHQNGWPTVAHLIGHTRLPGGDVAPKQGWQWNPLWTLGYALYPFVVLGPPAALLLIRAVRRDWTGRTTDPARWMASSFALWTALPITLFYGLVSLRTDIELNWAVAGLTVPLAPLARHLSDRLDADRYTRALWRWTIGVSVAAALLISFGGILLRPLAAVRLGDRRNPVERALRRVSGAARTGREIEALASSIAGRTGMPPLIIANGYSQASLLAFYMPSHPSVRSASSLLGGRKSAYDFFADTGLNNPADLGRPAVLYGATRDEWQAALRFDRVELTAEPGNVFIGYGYGGPLPRGGDARR